jgi:type I restriction enzyme M protein
MTLLFLKRLNDTFEENVDKLIQEGKSEEEAYGNKNRHFFFVPKQARWIVLSMASENIGEKIDHVCRLIERENSGSKLLIHTIPSFELNFKKLEHR